MHIQDSIIQAYLQDIPIEDAIDFSKLKGFKKPVSTRKEIVEELNRHNCIKLFNNFLFSMHLYGSRFLTLKNLKISSFSLLLDLIQEKTEYFFMKILL